MDKNKKQNDPIANLRDIDAAQGVGGFSEAQPKDGKGTKEQPKVEQKERVIDQAIEAKKWSDRFEVAKTYQLPLFQKWSKSET